MFIYAVLFGKPGKENGAARDTPKYDYVAKPSIMTVSEQAFYKTLSTAIGQEYLIFAQVRLSALVNHKVQNGQFWKAALAHINQKSVDYVLVDRETLATKLVIELDDKSHEREDRMSRDTEVERILKDASVPLLRVQHRATFEPSDLGNQIRTTLGK